MERLVGCGESLVVGLGRLCRASGGPLGWPINGAYLVGYLVFFRAVVGLVGLRWVSADY